jgi:hypothetical protein
MRLRITRWATRDQDDYRTKTLTTYGPEHHPTPTQQHRTSTNEAESISIQFNEPDIRGAMTIREQLAKHHEIATCAECHRKMDPLGFALENFDAIGGWRTSYQIDRKKLPIDASGKLPGGDSFSTFPEFRRHISERQDQFTRCLTEKLLTYAIGRELEIDDRSGIDSIIDQIQTKSLGLHDLIELVTLSEAFRNN